MNKIFFDQKNILYIKVMNYSWNIRLWMKNKLFANKSWNHESCYYALDHFGKRKIMSMSRGFELKGVFDGEVRKGMSMAIELNRYWLWEKNNWIWVNYYFPIWIMISRSRLYCVCRGGGILYSFSFFFLMCTITTPK
jgi:hypothetical protein